MSRNKLSYIDRINPNMNSANIKAFSEAEGGLAEKLGRVVHVAGTNGKGSTVAFLRALLEAHGFSVNVFTSPHLVDERERIRIKGKIIEETYYAQLTRRLEGNIYGPQLSIFEKFVAKALWAFTENAADFTILEVGLGGRLDATNIVSHPEVCVITPIALDHQHILGATEAQIAAEKAAIIKPHSVVVSAPQVSAVARVIKEVALLKQAQLLMPGEDWILRPSGAEEPNEPTSNLGASKASKVWASKGGWKLDLGPLAASKSVGGDPTEPSVNLQEFWLNEDMLGLKGAHQVENAALAVVVLGVLLQTRINQAKILTGLQLVSWPGRCQSLPCRSLYGYQFSPNSSLMVDGAHNAHGAAALAQYLKGNCSGAPINLVMGLMATKSLPDYLVQFKDVEGLSICAVDLPAGFSGFSSTQITTAAEEMGISSSNIGSLERAVKHLSAFKGKQSIIFCGSLYMIGQLFEENSIAVK